MHELPLQCRCLPSFDTAILNDIVSADAPATSVFMSTSSSPYQQYLDSAGQRLERYIADIQKGFAVIIVSGAPVASSPQASAAALHLFLATSEQGSERHRALRRV